MQVKHAIECAWMHYQLPAREESKTLIQAMNVMPWHSPIPPILHLLQTKPLTQHPTLYGHG